ncbi:MAG: amidase, partial [Bacteroidetes bacterium]|nr:amidase [Bacteroidota bacterium]
DAYAGAPLTNGSRVLKDNIPTYDSELVRRYKNTGLIIVGKTNTPEFGLMGYTEPDLFGACRNPWNTEHTPGGSSGGSGAAVSAGIVPMASGGDGGGSIRIPSSCCGLFGMKPSRGRLPTGPGYGELWMGAVVEGVISRSVRDSATMLDAVQGNDKGAPYIIEPPRDSYLKTMETAPDKLRIGFSTASPVGKDVHPDCISAVEKTAKLLESLGHHVEEARPQYNSEALAISYVLMIFGDVAADIKDLEKIYGKKAVKNGLELPTRTLGLLGRAITAGELSSALREWDRASRIMAAYFETYDLYLTPTLARPPIKIGELAMKPSERILSLVFNALGAGKLLRAAGIIDKIALDNLAAMPFTQMANVTGLPAMSVPLATTENGLPCGVHFTGPFGSESLMFKLAAQLEKAAPWFDKRPIFK